MTTEEFIRQYRNEDVAELALRIRQFPSVDAAFALQQIDGYQRAQSKLPTLSQTADWHWPVRLSVEQCSSEQTARYKRMVMDRLGACGERAANVRRECDERAANVRGTCGADLTGGLGVDTLFLSEGFETWHYVEMQEPLAALAKHNFAAAGRTNIVVHNSTAEEFLKDSTQQGFDLIYLDPARRNMNGGKVFRLSDCTPDVTALYSVLREKAGTILLKLSPMLDISEALSHLPDAIEVHVVAVQGEVKEVLIVIGGTADDISISAVQIGKDGETETFCFTAKEESETEADFCLELPEETFYLYEPNAAILKAGAFKLVGRRYGLQKLAANTHLYASRTCKSDFPGRIFEVHVAEKDELKGLKQANIICRNHPLKPEELRKKLKVKDGGENFVIGCRWRQKPIVLVGKKDKGK